MVVESDRWKLAFEYLSELEWEMQQEWPRLELIGSHVDALLDLVPSWIRDV